MAKIKITEQQNFVVRSTPLNQGWNYYRTCRNSLDRPSESQNVHAKFSFPIDSGFEIELAGKFAKIIALPGDHGSAVLGDYAGSVKVVAGAGFVQDPTKLELRMAV